LGEVCQRYGVARLDVFGSVARGSAVEDSDIDLLYTLRPGVHLGWAIEDLEVELTEVLGCKVDLVSRRALNARIRSSVLREARPFHAGA